jgi:hypothetical protein
MVNVCRNCGHANCHGKLLKLSCDSRWKCREYVPLDNLQFLEWADDRESRGLSSRLNIDVFRKILRN